MERAGSGPIADGRARARQGGPRTVAKAEDVASDRDERPALAVDRQRGGVEGCVTIEDAQAARTELEERGAVERERALAIVADPEETRAEVHGETNAAVRRAAERVHVRPIARVEPAVGADVPVERGEVRVGDAELTVASLLVRERSLDARSTTHAIERNAGPHGPGADARHALDVQDLQQRPAHVHA